jgi:DNA-binding response OmpR family regulator
MEPKQIEPTMTQSVKRVIFADFAVVKFNSLIQLLRKNGVEGEGLTESGKFMEKINQESFEVCVVNLLLGGIGPFELIQNIRTASKNPDIKIIVISRQVHKMNIQNTIRAGANDFVAEPFENEHLYQRVLYHLAPKQELDPAGYETSVAGAEAWPYLKLLLESTELLGRTERHQSSAAFYTLLKRVADMLSSNRTSLIIVESETNTGLVLAASDDPDFHDFPIALHKYPEILHVLQTGHFVMVEDVSQNLLTKNINEQVKSISIGSLLVFPVRFQGDVIGVMNVRRPKATELPSMDVIRILQAVANTLAAHSNVRAMLRKIYKDFTPAKAV